jgi:hypothetical protein
MVVSSCRLLATVDLCRVAFVRRDVSRDHGGDRVANSAPELFSAFVESKGASDWLWRRLADSEASALIALGTVAEHGLLRLFARQLRKFSIRDSQQATIRSSAKEGDLKWPSRYAHGRRKLEHRQRAVVPPFWEIEGEVAGGNWRTWRLAVVPTRLELGPGAADIQAWRLGLFTVLRSSRIFGWKCIRCERSGSPAGANCSNPQRNCASSSHHKEEHRARTSHQAGHHQRRRTALAGAVPGSWAGNTQGRAAHRALPLAARDLSGIPV